MNFWIIWNTKRVHYREMSNHVVKESFGIRVVVIEDFMNSFIKKKILNCKCKIRIERVESE